VNLVHNGLSVDVRRARFARALGLGPSGSLIIDVLGKADAGRTKKGKRRKPRGE